MSNQYDNDDQGRFKVIFDNSPIAIWEEDVSCFRELFDDLKKKHVTDLRKYLLSHLKIANQAFRKIKVKDVNKAAIKGFGAKTKKELCLRFGKTFSKEDLHVIIDEFCTLINGEKIFEAEFRTKGSNGKWYDLWLRVAVPNGFEETLSRIIVTIEDITEWKRKEKHLKRAAQEDSLTGLLNHKAIYKRLEDEFMRSQRYNTPMSCLMIDIDYFKPINDNFGHQVGDEMLKQVSALLKKLLRGTDLIGRYGGDEFLVILSETDHDGGWIVADRMRQRVATNKFALTSTIKISNTLSIGMTTYPANQAKTPKDFILMADKALYQAKGEGRNCIKVL